MPKGVLTGLLWFKLCDIPEDKLKDILDKYTYVNPKDESTFSTYVLLEDRVGLPAGDIGKLKGLVPNVTMDDRRVIESVGHPISLTNLTLRDYQEDSLKEIVEYFKGGGATLNLAGSAGSGKSVLIAALLAKLNIKTLLIAHMSMLTEQLFKELSEATDANVVKLDANNLKLGDINVATSQFISARPELWKEIKHHIGLIVIDESETAASKTTLRILQRAHAKYRVFVSATFSRSVDGRTQALKDLAGHKVVTLTRKDLLKPTVISVKCPECFVAPAHKHLYKKALIRFYKAHTSIDEKLLVIVQGSLKKKRQVLIACDLNDLQERYASMLEADGIRCALLNGGTSKVRRAEILEEYNNGTIDVILAFGVVVAGLSIPRISTIVRVSTPSSPEKLVQLIGRARRDYEGKDGAFVLDLTFEGFRSANAKRSQLYKRKVKEEGWSYTQTSWERLKDKLKE